MRSEKSKSNGGRAQAVHRAIKRAILDKALGPGVKLPETRLANSWASAGPSCAKLWYA